MMKSKRLRVMHIIPTMKTGGAERLLLDIIKRIDQTKFEASVVIFKEKGELYEQLMKLPVHVFFIPKKWKIDFGNIWKLKNIIKNQQPDIIHTHLGGDMYGRLLAHRLGISVVSTEHNINVDESKLITVVKRKTARFATRIIAVSKAVQEDMINRYRIDPKKIVVIYNGIDCDVFQRIEDTERKYDFSDKKNIFRIGAAGRLVEQKGFSFLIKAISLVKDEYFQIVCEIVGDGYLRSDLEALIKSYHLEKNVILSGVCSDMISFYKSINLLVMPSLWEGLGITVLEAGALEIPVVASSVDGLIEIIDDSVNGLLVQPGNARDIADKIINVITNYQRSLDRARLLAEKVRTTFSITDMVRHYENIYEDIASK